MNGVANASMGMSVALPYKDSQYRAVITVQIQKIKLQKARQKDFPAIRYPYFSYVVSSFCLCSMFGVILFPH